MKWITFALLSLAGAGVVASTQPLADATRRQRATDAALVFAPDGPMLRAASLDQHEPAADLLWVRSVLVFGERWKVDPDPLWVAWLRGTMLAVVELDPKWRTPYFYGGSLLRVIGDVDGSDMIFKRGAEQLPHDGYFAFSYAMNQYLYRDDHEAAAEWMDRAAKADKTATWYSSAAAAMRSKGGDRDGAIAYLEARRQEVSSDAERADVDVQLGRLYHDALAERFLPTCKAYLAEFGRPPASPEAFFAWAGTAVPENPRKDAWVVGLDGCVRSKGGDADRVRRVRQREGDFLKF